MGLNETPRADRIHIALFGKRNAGKSSLINALTGQELAIVSSQKGTTTDPVYKSMELLPLGPVVIIDTPGLDDEGDLGELRIKKALEVLNKTDIAILVISAEDYLNTGEWSTDGLLEKFQKQEKELLELIKEKEIPFLIVLNKADLFYSQEIVEKISEQSMKNLIAVSSKTKKNIHELKELLGKQVPEEEMEFPIVSDLVSSDDTVILVIPIDSAAPKGRLILPQQQTIRELLEAGIMTVCVRETELAEAFGKLSSPPKLVITDSQAFGKVSKDTPKDILLTSFSILFARHKGLLLPLVQGVKKVRELKDGDKILISEGCTHHRQCDDIGSVKIPRWLKEYTGKNLAFEFSSGMEFREDLSEYALVVHCGGCMLNSRQMRYRIRKAMEEGVPIVNYGILIAFIHGILERSLEPFPDILRELK
jgi:[FeFe] hydrogenase H-cluster maturation GTPase HydF